MPDARLTDAAARERITRDLGDTLFVEAGAGSGKTTALVDRVVALVTTGAAELRKIAAITFTEKAGTELRDRVRRELQQALTDAPNVEVAARCRLALDQLDGAAIGTLHSFAQRLLSENPIEARLPPRVEVLDEVSSGVEFDRRWSAFREELLADPVLERTLLLLLGTGVNAKTLDALARAFEANWDLVAEHVPESTPEPPALATLVAPVLAEIDAVCDERADAGRSDDKLFIHLGVIAEYAQRLRDVGDEYALLDALRDDVQPKRPSFTPGVGQQGNWPDVNGVRDRLRAAGEDLDRVRGQVGEACAERLGAAIRRFTLRAAEERRAAGQLEFHDLLVLARQLLRDPEQGPIVRARLHQRYTRLLLDEFQDTDPIQIELAVRISAADPADAALATTPWNEVAVAAGHLFVVGDPKQSIYRFRRADISTFLEARTRFGQEVGTLVELTSNFRSTEPVITWVNHVFDRLMSETPDVNLPVPSQPKYVALDATRSAPPDGPPLAVVGREPHPYRTTADDMREAEAGDVAATVARVITEGWSVREGDTGWRAARLGDITILVPARTSLPFLQDALDERNIPHRAESSSLVYATRAVRDLLMVLRAVNDPTNGMHLVAALRTALLGCGDDDLFRFKIERGGRWTIIGDQPETVPADDPVGTGIAYLRSLYEDRVWCSPSELLDRIARDRRALELGFGEGRPRDVWRRLRFVMDQARAWSDATAGSLREYVHWVEMQSAEGSRVAEAILPETDDDAVRIMTIHAAKGLEFPITIVSGMSTKPGGQYAPARVAFPPEGGVAYRFGRFVQTSAWSEWNAVDEQMSFDERIRLLYVACTRACDHLVLSVHRVERKSKASQNARTNAELLVDGMVTMLDGLPDAVVDDEPRFLVPAPTIPTPIVTLEAWTAERAAALVRGTRPTAVAATALTDEGAHDPAAESIAGLQKRPRDLDLPPWLKGRYGTAVGRAVHGALQTIDLATGDGLDAAVAAQCEAEAIPDRADQVRRLVADALRSPSVVAAAGRAHWREVYACTPVNGRLLEGYIDLLYRESEGLVVLDYKTSATDDPVELDRRVEGYRLQGASYALTIAATTDEPVSRVTFLFLTPKGPVERHLNDLVTAVARVRALVTSGHEIAVEEIQ